MKKKMTANRGGHRLATLHLCLAVSLAFGPLSQIAVWSANQPSASTALGASEHLRYSIPTNAVQKSVPLSSEDGWCSKKIEYWLEGTKVGERRWWKNGQLSDERPMRNGENHGIWAWWREDGKVLSQHSYKDGLLHGMSSGWNKNGKLQSERPYENDKKHGMEREWNSKGVLVWEFPYKEGRLHGVARYFQKNAELQVPSMKMPKPLTFWIEGKEVSEPDYIEACMTNATLPRIKADK